MKKLLSLCLAALLLLCCACGKDETQKTDAPVQQDGSSAVSDTVQSTDPATYSISKDDLLGTWKLSFYSYDNEQYFDYVKDISEAGSYSFYPDGTAVIRNSETDEAVYRYTLPDNQKGNILFYDIVTGEAAPFFFGYGVMNNETGMYLIISKYNSSEKSVMYLILSEVF